MKKAFAFPVFFALFVIGSGHISITDHPEYDRVIVGLQKSLLIVVSLVYWAVYLGDRRE